MKVTSQTHNKWDFKTYINIKPEEVKYEDIVTYNIDIQEDQQPIITIYPPKYAAQKRKNVRMVALVDVSGSMSYTKAKITDPKTHQKTTLNKNILDVAKLALKALIDNLEATDLLAIVTFSTDARTRFEMALMTPENKETAKRIVDSLFTENMTYLNLGVEQSLAEIQRARSSIETTREYHDGIVCFTDGESNDALTESKRAGAYMVFFIVYYGICVKLSTSGVYTQHH